MLYRKPSLVKTLLGRPCLNYTINGELNFSAPTNYIVNIELNFPALQTTPLLNRELNLPAPTNYTINRELNFLAPTNYIVNRELNFPAPTMLEVACKCVAFNLCCLVHFINVMSKFLSFGMYICTNKK